MNNDLISRSALLDDIQADVDYGGVGGAVAGALKRYVRRAPAVEAVPVRTGRWDEESEGSAYYGKVVSCSECGAFLKPRKVKAYKFCYNCGAKMDKEA